VASIPVNYDRHLGPLFFRGFAEEMAALLDVRPGMRVLETACGTSIVTERLVARLGAEGHLIATDLNEPMLAHASAKRLPGNHPRMAAGRCHEASVPRQRVRRDRLPVRRDVLPGQGARDA